MDPVGWLDRSLDPRDLELLSFLLQGISYGRVEQIRISFEKLLTALIPLGVGPNGAGIYTWLQNSDPLASATTQALRGWKHRLNLPGDLQKALTVLKNQVLQEGNSIAHYFNVDHEDEFETRILSFCQLFANPKARTSKTWRGTGAQWFAPSPAAGGTSKRLMMWLRWMIRQDTLDLGLWPRLLGPQLKISPAQLYVPVDTHIFKFAREWNLVTHKSPTWSSVKSITAALREVDPQDPVRFDFAICHAGKLAARSL